MKNKLCILPFLCYICAANGGGMEINMKLVFLKTDNEAVNTAYYTAVSDLTANIKPFCGGILREAKPVIIAGIGYCTPWTRDAAINTNNAGALLCPEYAKNTMLSVLREEDGRMYIGGEYWDAIIWVWGAWSLYLHTGDKEFLKTAYEASKNSIEYFENTELDKKENLFRGAACYGDGVAAYPDIYASPGQSGIIVFAKERRELCSDRGVGLPMFSLSTNCLYYKAYVTADEMAAEMEKEALYEKKAEELKLAINKHFWNEEKGLYNYLIDPFGGCDYSEGIGQAFAVLFGIADDKKCEKIFKNQPITENGIACVYPSFKRYLSFEKGAYGRHSGTVWPHIQSFWADAAAKNSEYELFEKEFNILTHNAVRDGYFAELYHPDTGLPYGGLQEDKKQGKRLWDSEKKQTWSATGYLHMIFNDILGMTVTTGGIELAPHLPRSIGEIKITELHVRDITLDVSIKKGSEKKLFIPFSRMGKITVKMGE